VGPRYWETQHPQAEQGDLEQRIGNLSWLNTRLTHLVRQLPLTQAPNAAYGLAQHEGAMSLHARLARGADQDVISQGLLSVEAFNQAKMRTPHAFYRA
jgi:type VI secretion system protein ImpA